MNSNEFVSWLKGFVDACGEDLNKEQLTKVKTSLEDVTEVRCLERVQPSLPITPYPYPSHPNTGTPPEIWCSTNTGGVNFRDITTTT